MRQLVFVVLLFFAWSSALLAQDAIHLPCEVLEVSPRFQVDCSRLKGLHYILIHHANASDRARLSKWLKANSGKQVTFIIKDKKYKGVLCRMAHCFGRGLLVYAGRTEVRARDIIELVLPSSSQ